MDKWLFDHLVCPRDKKNLKLESEVLVCQSGHSYPVVEDIPIMLVDDEEFTHDYIRQTLEKVSSLKAGNHECIKGQTEIENGKIDEFVQGEIPYTSGNLYFSVQYKLSRYPIPNFRLPEGNGARLLDIGCNWGRWSIAAAQKGYRPVGLEPSLDAVLAARRVSRQLNVETNFVVGDSRFLPFEPNSFDVVFSYSVLQHLSKNNVRITLDEAAQVLKKGGKALIQMPNKYGIRQLQQQWRRSFTEGEGFEVRYWTPRELLRTFEAKFGRTSMTTDCFFGLGIQGCDADMLPFHYKCVVYSSELLRKSSHFLKPLTKVADSVYLESLNENKP
ncbi:MAG: methyltransferase domain-containing protein [Blastocatellia bacterium]